MVRAWLAAGLAQSERYDAVRQTISVLAGYAATDRWIMTPGLYAVSICQIVLAAGLTVARPRARLLLVLGGAAGLGLAAFPQPQHDSGAAHMVFAALSVTFLALWPATLGPRHGTPRRAEPAGSVLATLAFLGLLAWEHEAAHGGGGALGVVGRVDTAIENSWPLGVILAIRRAGRVSASPSLLVAPRPIGAYAGCMWRALANAIAGIHYAYMAYMLVGGFIAWRWRKTIVLHVLAVVWAVLVVTTKVPCPLTALQNNFRERAGASPLSDSFINLFVRGTFYPEGQQTLSRLVAAAVVLVSWIGYYYLGRSHRASSVAAPSR